MTLNPLRKLLTKINKINQNQWLICSIFTTMSGMWFSLILGFFGSSLCLTKINENGDKVFTILGGILTLVTVGWSLLSLIAQRYCEYHNKNIGISQENLENSETFFNSLNSSSANIIEKGVTAKLAYVERVLQTKSTTMPTYPIKKPCETLSNITCEMAQTLSKLLSYKKYNVRYQDLFVNIYYSFPQENDQQWYKAHSVRSENGLSIEELLKPNTAFFEALNSNKNYVYYNDKEMAIEQNHYVPDPDDIRKNKNVIGSIACYLYEIKRNSKVYIKFMITLSSYGKKFSKINSDDDNVTAINLKRCFFPEYEMLIKSALTDLYITHIFDCHKNSEEWEKTGA